MWVTLFYTTIHCSTLVNSFGFHTFTTTVQYDEANKFSSDFSSYFSGHVYTLTDIFLVFSGFVPIVNRFHKIMSHVKLCKNCSYERGQSETKQSFSDPR